MNIGFQIDAVESLNIQTDSSLPLALESQKRQNKNFCYLPSTLTYKNNTVYAEGREIYFNNNKLENFKLTKKVNIKLDTLDYIFVRQDPPYNMEYISSLHILEQLADKVKIINN